MIKQIIYDSQCIYFFPLLSFLRLFYHYFTKCLEFEDLGEADQGASPTTQLTRKKKKKKLVMKAKRH